MALTGMNITKLLIATKNLGKTSELRELLSGLPIEITDLSEFVDVPEVEETGRTFSANADLKATNYARITGLFAIADDSGLEVDSLGGAPGVRSARFAGDRSDDAMNTQKLLSMLGDTDVRTARFVCAISMADPDGNVLFRTEGECRGRIAAAPLGQNGFGYDPVFVPDGYDQTFGQLDPGVKSELSHRSKALKKLRKQLPFI